jgi:hypothetical protein
VQTIRGRCSAARSSKTRLANRGRNSTRCKFCFDKFSNVALDTERAFLREQLRIMQQGGIQRQSDAAQGCHGLYWRHLSIEFIGARNHRIGQHATLVPALNFSCAATNAFPVISQGIK